MSTLPSCPPGNIRHEPLTVLVAEQRFNVTFWCMLSVPRLAVQAGARGRLGAGAAPPGGQQTRP